MTTENTPQAIAAAYTLIASMDKDAAAKFLAYPEARRDIIRALYESMDADPRLHHLADEVAFELLGCIK